MNHRQARFEAVFREVYEPLQRYARRRTDLVTADDVVADALTVLWRRLDEVPDGSALPWCYGVARRCLANHRRGDARRNRLVERLMSERVGAEVEPDPILAEALAELSLDDRELVRLWAWEELPPRDIGMVLGITANAASIRLHRVRGRLGDALERKSARAAGHTVGGNTHVTDSEEER
jgi:RNA polymerase sigma-70 factor (ECF subfamily)